MAEEELIKRFVELQAAAEQLLKEEKIAEAKQKYLEVVDAYNSIDKSTLERFHKELAHDQVTALFKKVNEAKERVKVPYHLITAAILVIGFSMLVLFNPSIVGLAGFEDLIRQPVEVTFTESRIHQITLRDRPLTLSASGNFSGKAKIFFKQGEKLELVFDSETSPSIEGVFADVCEETCDVIAKSNVVELFVQVEEGSTLALKEVSYKVERTDNSAPVWIGKTRTFEAESGETTKIDLQEYFEDPENDPLVFLSTTDAGLEVSVENSRVSITPEKGSSGRKNLIFIASDLLEVTRISVTVEVK